METYILVLDSFLSLLLFGPLVAAFWRGTWGLLDIYMLPDNQVLSLCASLVWGLLVYLAVVILQSPMMSLNKKMGSPVFYIVSRLHSYILSIAIVNHWRGIWGLLNMTGATFLSAGLTLGVSTTFLVLCRGMCNTVSAPLLTISDIGREEFFRITTVFKTQPRASLRFYMDSCFSVVIIIGFVIAKWRGMWTLIDLLLTPDDAIRSAWLSVIAGNILAVLLFIIQWPVMYLANKLRRLKQTTLTFFMLLFIEDILSFLGFVASNLVWRGFWNLQDQCLLVHNKELSNWVSHGVAVVILMAVLHYNMVMQAGLGTDGDIINSEDTTFFETKFITNFIQHSSRTYDLGADPPTIDVPQTAVFKIETISLPI
ncbi:hypothetical protein SNE40_009011 [Patella caerulea]|uniref:Uncharacterized protein n=1 Tax=Patella caerulea TaxID=87958 RepID=A0AAN8PX85_PATCE